MENISLIVFPRGLHLLTGKQSPPPYTDTTVFWRLLLNNLINDLKSTVRIFCVYDCLNSNRKSNICVTIYCLFYPETLIVLMTLICQPRDIFSPMKYSARKPLPILVLSEWKWIAMMEPVVIIGRADLPQNLPNHGDVLVLPKMMKK